MPDFLTKSKRSALMATIRSRGNKDTELKLLQFLRRYRIIGWRRNQKMFGSPDFVFREARLAVFVDGCFWHGCPEHSQHAVKSGEYWRKKLMGNKARDRLVTRTLRREGWQVLRIWEHELKRKNQSRCLRRIRKALSQAEHSHSSLFSSPDATTGAG
jgi:DNA mismatch endonuclease (patch repair protein)